MKRKAEFPESSRPFIPGYGIPGTREGLLPWSYIQDRMRNARNYWISTANAKGQPHATPVWGVWLDDVFYFDGSPNTRRGRDMAANRLISVHLEDGSKAVIMEGEVLQQKNVPLELGEKLSIEYTTKYRDQGYSPTPENWQDGGLYTFHPALVLAWTHFPLDTTRWYFKK